MLVCTALFTLGGCGQEDGRGGSGPGGGSGCCAGDERPGAKQAALHAVNYGIKIGWGQPVGASELSDIQAEYESLCPDCKDYYEQISEQLDRLVEEEHRREIFRKWPL